MIKRKLISYFTKSHLEYSGETSLQGLVDSVHGGAFEAVLEIENEIEESLGFVSYISNSRFFNIIIKTNEEDYL